MSCYLFFFNDTATTEIYTLSLHDALPIWRGEEGRGGEEKRGEERGKYSEMCFISCEQKLPYSTNTHAHKHTHNRKKKAEPQQSFVWEKYISLNYINTPSKREFCLFHKHVLSKLSLNSVIHMDTLSQDQN